jgi:hypothetical protein
MHRSDVIDAPHLKLFHATLDSRWRREFDAFARLLPELQTTHRGKFVAVYNA